MNICEIIVDSREKHLINKCNYSINVELLDIGDIQFKVNGEIIIIIERKTIDDFTSSIKSDRYREQKYRLLNSNIPNKNIFYVIEGKIPKMDKINGLPIKTLYSAMLNTILRDNMNIFRTRNLRETLLLIEQIRDKINKQYKNGELSFTKNTTYESTFKAKKKNNMTKKSCFIYQLSQIPNISVKIAQEIVENFESMTDLCNKIKDDPKCLKNIKGLGKNRIANICDYLC